MKKILTTVVFSLLASTAMASEVYIDQAGGDLTVNILQENGNNRINTEADPMNIEGNDITIDITQSGDANEADLEFESGATTTTFTYSATGDMNILTGKIFGGINNTFTTDIVGSDNVMTYCQTYTNSVCNGIIVNNTDTTTNIIGSNNIINYALDSADAVNTVDVGQTTASNFNEIHLFQTSAGGFNQVSMTVDGNNNIINVDQQTAMGYTYVNMTVTGSSNTVDILQN
jgi:hypothetical protein